ncbi:NUDIX domain-containing protein [Neobacillus terrae]|uniref:NUDIX domain-containing protein n=1 Tax=Neobacillus terrae TaxID=3034837 RepID=UPI001408CCBB|nr:NUDIX hydrolase [Neobacillus terrae]NHM32806.1 NUDIX hydrolase [Neobacillus terrae]
MPKENKRGKVWLAAAGLVKSEDGRWLVVKKKYGGLKGSWSLPAGFVEAGETADEAAVREVKEETGINCRVKGLIGLRTGVIKGQISDNMLVFHLERLDDEELKHQETELFEAKFISTEELAKDKEASVLLHFLIEIEEILSKQSNEGINPGDQFGYTSYKLFF